MTIGKPKPLAIPKVVWALGFISFFTDFSSELVHSLLPIFLVSTLGTNISTLGWLEGVAEAIALVVKIFSGAISDFLRRRKTLLLLGYGIAALTRLSFPLASSVEVVFTARIIDRIGSGFRGAPREAFIADVAPAKIRGACYGLRQAMSAVGACSGPLFAILLMYLLNNDVKKALWFAVLPAFIGVAWILFGIKEPPKKASLKIRRFRSPIRFSALKLFSKNYWWTLAVAILFMLARFSQVFLVLRAQEAGMDLTWAPSAMVIMSLAYSLSAYPVGRLSDHMGRTTLFGIGIFFLIVADIFLASNPCIASVLIGAIFWGLHMGFTEGMISTMIADTAPRRLMGTAFGLFYLASGSVTILTNVLAGWLWDHYNATVTFYAGASVALAALITLGLKSKT